MKKLMVIAASAALAILAIMFAPAPATAGDLDDLTALGDEGDDKPAADKSKRSGGGGGGGPKLADIQKQLDEMKAEFASYKEVNKAENVNSENIHEHLVPFYIVLVIGILSTLIGVILTVKSFGLRADIRKAMEKADELKLENEGIAGTLLDIQDELDNKADKVSSTPPPAPAPGP